MPENPLLPDADLRSLLGLVRLGANLKRNNPKAGLTKKARPLDPLPAYGQEAVLAATLLQLSQGDLFVAAPEHHAAAEMLRRRATTTATPATIPAEYLQGASALLMAATAAAALHFSKTDRVVVVLTQAGLADPAWQHALAWAQQERLPLLLICTDPSGAAVFSHKRTASSRKLAWSAVSTLATAEHLPVLTVDGEDAVAMYRAMQESILRARTGGGPAIVWAALPTPQEIRQRPRTRTPLTRLASYLRARGLALR